jgi:hypothetical protein
VKWILSNFSEIVMALNHLWIQLKVYVVLKPSRLKLLHIILVSSANNIGLDFPLICFDESFT